MAAGSRVSSSSKRARLNIFAGYALAAAGALLGAALLVLSLLRPTLFSGPRGVAQDAVSPVTTVGGEVRSGSLGILAGIEGYFRAGAQNARLKREVELARIRLGEAAAVQQENQRLRGLLGLAQEGSEPVAVTRLVSSTAASPRRFGYIGVGSSRGVTPGMPVRSARGVVGRVLETGRSTARILLLTDSESVLPVRLANGEAVAFAHGRGDSLLRIRLINLGLNPLKRGDMFVTSGAGGYFPPGIAVALVEEVTDDGALARIIADPAASDFVAVEPIFQPQAVRAAAAEPPSLTE
ncbi:rod shape-determining protein MreC [Porphyrobacter sp. GA68]|uniref:rod shape-determining protein MreC n=1 Tax=Porphyrobacter sp. GA68 TaxID=2883480 RepID=UPI001D18EBF2|nr:rod shape-determining protein MreC [Porphyrobacter sp. GA68]